MPAWASFKFWVWKDWRFGSSDVVDKVILDGSSLENAEIEDLAEHCYEACSKSAACGAFSWTSTTQMFGPLLLKSTEFLGIFDCGGYAYSAMSTQRDV